MKGEGVVKSQSGGLLQSGILVGNAGLVESLFHLEDGSLGGFQDGVEPPDDSHGQDNVAILAPDVNIPKNVVSNAPDEVGDPVELASLH